MTDLEITKLCAAAMGFNVIGAHPRSATGMFCGRKLLGEYGEELYDPLHDKAQALELVERFHLWIQCDRGEWFVTDGDDENKFERFCGGDLSGNLLRAICECVAKLEAHRQGARG